MFTTNYSTIFKPRIIQATKTRPDTISKSLKAGTSNKRRMDTMESHQVQPTTSNTQTCIITPVTTQLTHKHTHKHKDAIIQIVHNSGPQEIQNKKLRQGIPLHQFKIDNIDLETSQSRVIKGKNTSQKKHYCKKCPNSLVTMWKRQTAYTSNSYLICSPKNSTCCKNFTPLQPKVFTQKNN